MATSTLIDNTIEVDGCPVICIKGVLDLDVIRSHLGQEDTIAPVVATCDNGERYAMGTIVLNCAKNKVWGDYKEVMFSVDVYQEGTESKGIVRSVQLGDLNKEESALAIWYNRFNTNVSNGEYIHSLYLDNKEAIEAGRVLLALPKHPTPCEISIQNAELSSENITAQIQWKDGGNIIGKLSTRRVDKKWRSLRAGALLIQMVGLKALFSSMLLRKQYKSVYFVPRAIATYYQKSGVRLNGQLEQKSPPHVWPWNPSTDVLELHQDSVRPTRCEANNGAALFAQAGFRPLGVTYIEETTCIMSEDQS